MNIQGRQSSAGITNSKSNMIPAMLWLMMGVLFLLCPPGAAAQAQDNAQSELTSETGQVTVEPEDVKVSLPDSHQMAMALASPGFRQQALLDLAVAANVLGQVEGQSEIDHISLAEKFISDRTWLQMLVSRYGWVQPHSSVLDPAAWLVLKELQQHDLAETALVAPGHISESVLIHQVFQRAGQRLAVDNLPILLSGVEADAITLWAAFIQLTGGQGTHDAAWKAVELAWFTDRKMPVTQIQGDVDQNHEPVIENILKSMSQLVLSTVDARPPDSKALVQIRYSLLKEMSDLAGVENDHRKGQIRDSLHLVSLVDGLHDGRYFELIRGLLSITSRLLEHPANVKDGFLLVDWMVAELPAISAHYAVDFARVDPRLNTTLATVYDVLLIIAHSESDSSSDNVIDINAARGVLADAVAQLALLIPDMAYYFDMPVRNRIVEEINICISIAASLDDDGIASMTRQQFDACLETLLQMADQEIRQAELSGDINGPFTTDTLSRELSVTPWQRINYGIGYLHERYPDDCQPPVTLMPNPLEWAVLATTMTWLAEYSPEFFQTPDNETRLTKMRNIGEQLILGLAEQTRCLAASGTGINDLVSRSMADYELALRALDLGMKSAEEDYRNRQLSPGADVSFQRDALQKTTYRPEDIVIEPCNKQEVCEMSGELSTTRALIGLFPDEYLVAQQTGMGSIDICYRNMEWVRRRSELIRPDDENVANYFGYLSFDLVGRYIEKGQVSDIFGFRFTSPKEHHYLFAQTSEDVLNDSCPVEWVGSRVTTPLRENRGGMVPNRLTYLAASRKLPSRLLQNNWDRGAEWRDWFVTGIGVSSLELDPTPEILTRLNQHLQSLYQAEQAEIYQQILLPNTRSSQGDDVSLFDEMSQVSIAKAMIRMQIMLFYPQSMFNSDTLRMAIAGDAGLLEGRTLRRFREDNVALTSVNGIARERLDQLRQAWAKQPETVRLQGSVPASLMHALTRINILYRQFFTSRPEPLQEIKVAAQSQSQ